MSKYVAEQWKYGDEQDNDAHVRDWRMNQIGAMLSFEDWQRFLASDNTASLTSFAYPRMMEAERAKAHWQSLVQSSLGVGSAILIKRR